MPKTPKAPTENPNKPTKPSKKPAMKTNPVAKNKKDK
jgi:hypothetical protein